MGFLWPLTKRLHACRFLLSPIQHLITRQRVSRRRVFFLLLAFFLSFSIISDKFELKWLHCNWNIKSIMTSSERLCQTNWSDYLFCDQILLTLISRGSANEVINVTIESAISLQILYHYLCRDGIDNGCATSATMLRFLLLYHCMYV